MVPREAAQQIDYLARGFSIEFAEALIGEQELWILNHQGKTLHIRFHRHQLYFLLNQKQLLIYL